MLVEMADESGIVSHLNQHKRYFRFPAPYLEYRGKSTDVKLATMMREDGYEHR